MSAGTLSIGNGGTTGSLVGNVTNNAAMQFNRTDVSTYGGVISGTGSLNKLASGTLTLTGVNTYSGVTTVNGGTLALTGTASFASSPIIQVSAGNTLDVTGLTGGLNHDGVRFSLASGQTLRGTGTVGGGIDLRTGSSLAAGAHPATTNVEGSVDFQPGSTLSIQLNGLTDTDADRSRLLLDGALTFAGTAGNPFAVDVSNFGLFSGGSAATFTIASTASIASTSLNSPLTVVMSRAATAQPQTPAISGSARAAEDQGDQFSLQRSSNLLLLSFTPFFTPGDYNHNGIVDAADYVVWRKNRWSKRYGAHCRRQRRQSDYVSGL